MKKDKIDPADNGETSKNKSNSKPEAIFGLDAIADHKSGKAVDFDSPFADNWGDRLPYVGEIVRFISNPDDKVAKANNNDGPIPAIVTRVWSNVCVNLKIVPDCGPMQDRTSVVRKDANPAGYHFEYIT